MKKILFLCHGNNGLPIFAMHWQHRLKNMARTGINPKTLQYLMGHSE